MSLRVLSTPLQGSSLARIAISGQRDSEWFVARPSSAAQWQDRAAQIRESLMERDWLDALSPAFESTGAAHDRLSRAATSGFVVTAGQQPGLFGGPLYTWWKALSAIALADRLEEITGVPVAPVYWAATDDSDFDEAAYTVIPTSDGAERIEIKSNPAEGRPLSEIPIEDLSKQLAMLAEAAGSASNASVVAAVKSAYAPGNTLGSAYVNLLRTILGPLGVSVLDASHPAVRTTAFPLMARALERSQQVEDALARRAVELKAAGHSVQVKLVPGRSLVFGDESGTRVRITSKDAAEALAGSRPGQLGPNVLLRPVVESSILPTVAYLGGPAEVAYFAQVTSVAAALDVPAPLVVPRWSGVVVEPRIQRLLDKHSLQVEDFRDPHAVETRMARASVPEALKEKIRSLSESVNRGADELSRTEGADLAPPSVVEGLKRNMGHRLSRLERRFAAGVKRRGSESLHDAAILRGSLFPLGVPQERALNGIPLIARYGGELFTAVMEETRKHAAKLA